MFKLFSIKRILSKEGRKEEKKKLSGKKIIEK
jgi:hypothetical protein